MFEKISVIGLGYIGLPTATIFALRQHKVVGVDSNPRVVEAINKGHPHIFEPSLDRAVQEAVNEGFLRATSKPETADAFIIAVPTPFKGNHVPDLSFVESAAHSISPVLKAGDLVVLESTSPIGTTENLSRWLAGDRPDLSFPHQRAEDSDVQVAYCAERVLPGQVLQELVSNDRIIGGMSAQANTLALHLYHIFVEGKCITTDSRTAEMCKLTENAFRDLNIAFANELSIICDKLNINVWELIKLANCHPRVDILKPGPGVGGHCIAVDPWFVIHSAPEEAKLMRMAREVNNSKPYHVVKEVKEILGSCFSHKVACFGLSFKANIDDLRESPSVNIVQELAQHTDVELALVEPHIEILPENLSHLKNIKLVTLEKALSEAEVLIFLVPHEVFKKIPPKRLEGKKVIDFCGIWK